MKEYKAKEWFNIDGRGKFAVVSVGRENRGPNVGDHVKIDGTEYQVAGVERFTKLMYPPIQSDDINILIRELRPK